MTHVIRSLAKAHLSWDPNYYGIIFVPKKIKNKNKLVPFQQLIIVLRGLSQASTQWPH